MTHSHKHPKSKYEWFRLDVPKRLIALAGTTSWKKSLGTTDKHVAAIKRAELTSHYNAEIIRLDAEPNREGWSEPRPISFSDER